MVIPKESVSLQSIGKTIRKPHKFVLNPPAQPFPSLPKQSKQNKRRRRRRWWQRWWFSTSLLRIRERNSDISVTKDVFRFRIVSFPATTTRTNSPGEIKASSTRGGGGGGVWDEIARNTRSGL